MNTHAIDRIAELAADTAMRAAVQYIRQHQLKYNIGRLVECLRAHVKKHMNEALDDAKQALDANMTGAALQTFQASMVLAGIDATKEACQCH